MAETPWSEKEVLTPVAAVPRAAHKRRACEPTRLQADKERECVTIL